MGWRVGANEVFCCEGISCCVNLFVYTITNFDFGHTHNFSVMVRNGWVSMFVFLMVWSSGRQPPAAVYCQIYSKLNFRNDAM